MTSNKIFPSCDDFIAAFGCDCNINDELIQSCEFKDLNGYKITLSISHVDSSIRILMVFNDLVICDLFFDSATDIFINEEDNIICITLLDEKRIYIKVWENISVSMC